MKDLFRKLFRRENALIIVLLLAAILGLFGVPQSLGITSEQIMLALLTVLALDILIERLGYLDRIETQLQYLGQKIQLTESADSVFHFHEELPSFNSFLSTSKEVWIAGKSLTLLIAGYGKDLERAVQQGKKFRILITNPENSALMSILSVGSYQYSEERRARRLMDDTIPFLKRISQNGINTNVQVRLTDFALPSSTVIFDGLMPTGFVFVEFYGYKISSDERRHVCLIRSKEPKTYDYFIDQFENVWRDAKSIEG